MSQRRMTSLEVIGTDAFADMPQSSQLLYFHLNARADDDGFVSNPKSIMRNCGSQGDDLKLLQAKKFVIAFEDGVCVIKHWRINNFIRKDIYKETKYLDLKRSLFIRPNGSYTLTSDERAVPVPDGHYNLEDVNVPSTKRQPRLGKVRVVKDRLGKDNKNIASQSSADPIKSIKKEEDNVPMTLEEFVTSCRSSPRRYIKLVGEFADEKKLSFTTKAQWRKFLNRNLRPAKDLEPFTDQQIGKAMKDIKESVYITKWTLETLFKYITK